MSLWWSTPPSGPVLIRRTQLEVLPDAAGPSGAGVLVAGYGIALALMYSSHVVSQSVQPLPRLSLREVFLIVRGEPMSVWPNNHFASRGDMLTHPCDTLRLP